MFVRDYPPGMHIYRQHDPAGNLYLIEKGAVDLLDPQEGFQAFEHLTVHDVFGRMSFLTGMPRATEAIARTEVRLTGAAPRGLSGSGRIVAPNAQ